MAFFPRFTELSPLFHLLDDYEAHRSRPTCRRSTRTPTTSTTTTQPTFTPAFDVRELDSGYYLDGELPGVVQSNIDIEFSDPQTLVIKGRTEREYAESTTTNSNKDIKSTSPASRWRQPTVQNEDEDEAAQSNTDSDTTTTAEPASNHDSPYHYWVSERSIGNFQRTFTFPTRVDQDAVRANLKNGVLSVFVPKEAAPQTKKIRVL
ncbi:30 kDa heat shock protein [Penicillium riverlandense]|uniref:30 kDa heat shock protein n=1 Tax=Penicillium riverlandense TaxID=1903569 RepID=UPI002546A866|nr:30 kDa heat shock protein [Penicillium riverlandense]KAJ5818308.1 30 kDa heat shock protein [Penicillium riverlandense]